MSIITSTKPVQVITNWVCLLPLMCLFSALLSSPITHAQPVSPGAIAGQYSTTESGAASYNIPIVLAPGTAGLIPTLSLSYNSSGPSGLMGPGWSLAGLSAITRCAADSLSDGFISGVSLTTSDRFCLDGQKLKAISGSYGADGTEYRTQVESYSRVFSYGQSGSGPAYFVVQLKSGLRLELGNTPDSQLRTSNNQTVVAWNVNRVSDRSGNFYTVNYLQDLSLGFTAPEIIRYTGNSAAGITPYNAVVIEYEPRSIGREAFIGGERYAIHHRIKKITSVAQTTPVMSYSISYDHEPISHEDRVTSVTQCGSSGSCLPATTFAWTAPSSLGAAFVSGQTFNQLSPGQGVGDGYNYPFFPIDVDQDGLSDLVRVRQHDTAICLNSRQGGFSGCNSLPNFGQQTWPNSNRFPMIAGDWNGTGRIGIARALTDRIVSYDSTATPGGYTQRPDLLALTLSQSYNEQDRDPLFVGDWNGDGRTDLARGHTASNSLFHIEFRLSMGESFSSASWSNLTISNPNNYLPYVFTGDWNGDGLGDFAVTWENKPIGTNRILFYTSTGSGFQLFQDLPQPQLSPNDDSFSSVYSTILTGDWNADGLTEFGIVGHYGIKFYRSTGTGMQFWMELSDLGREQLGSNIAATIHEFPFVIGDWNGDGRTDLARVTTGRVAMYAAHPNGFELIYGINDLSPAQGYGDSDTHPILVGDWNGDGLADIGRVNNTGIKFYTKSPSNTVQISRIADGLGKLIEIEYGLLTDPAVYSRSSTAVYPLIDVQPAGEVVKSVRTSNGLGSFSTLNHTYAGLRYNAHRRSSLGFESAVATDLTTGISTSYFYLQNFPFDGRPRMYERRASNGTLIERQTNTWNSLTLATGNVLPYTAQTLEEDFELNGSLTFSKVTINSVDSFGNIPVSVTVFSDNSTVTTQSTFNNDVSNWLIGQIASVTVTNQAGGSSPPPGLTRRTAFSYMPVRGLLLTETIEPNNAAFTVVKSYGYDIFGNTVSTSITGADFQTRTSSSTYDSYGRFATRLTNSIGHSSTQQYSALTGAITSVTDANGLTLTKTYDDFGRLIREQRPDGTETQLSYQWPEPTAPGNAAYKTNSTVTGAPSQTVYYDELGREVRTVTTGFAGRLIYVDKVYNERGSLTHVSEPYFLGSPVYWSVTDYDLLNRSILLIRPGNVQTSITYNGRTTITTNPLGQTTTDVVDARGNLVSVTDNLGYTLRFVRDSRGEVVRTIDHLGNFSDIQYDLAGRKVSVSTPDSGVSLFRYNSIGEVVSTTNAAGQLSQFTYDRLGRLLTRSSLDGTERWVYDTAPNGIGKLSAVIGLRGFQESYYYDGAGRLSQTIATISGNQYKLTSEFDQYGRLAAFTYPSGLQLKYSYDLAGYHTAVRQSTDGKTIWRALARNARGQLESQKLGNGLTTTRQYSALNGYLERVVTGSVQDLSIQYNALGNVTQRSDVQRNLTESVVYDGLNRVTNAIISGGASIAVTYNEIGNITSRSDVGTYTYPAPRMARPHAVTTISGLRPNSYSYDARGNRVASTGGSVVYSVTGHPTLIRQGNNSIQFDLSPNNARVEERTYTGTTLIETKQLLAGGMYEKVSRGGVETHVHYVSAGDGPVAIIKTNGTAHNGGAQSAVVRYLHLDHLGSIQTITNEAGAITEVLAFDPWGKRRDPYTWGAPTSLSSQISRGFTGHEQLDAVNLVHMNGRVYDPVIGRFISPDPFIESPTNMQSYNSYSYVLNNPLTLTDPSGYFSFRSAKKWALRTFRTVQRQGAVLAAAFVGGIVGGPVAGPFISAFFANFTKSIVNGGGLSSSLRAGLDNIIVNGLRGHLDRVVGHGLTQNGGFTKYGPLALAAAHGVTDAAFASVVGGNARAEFLSGFSGSLGGSLAGKFTDSQAMQYASAAMLGGTGAALGGGKFSDGAMRGAFIYLFNHSFSSLNQAFPDLGREFGLAQAAAERGGRYAKPKDFDWSLLLAPIDKVGEMTTDLSPYLVGVAEFFFNQADRLEKQNLFFLSPIPRLIGFAAGTYGLIGASPDGASEVVGQVEFMARYTKQGLLLLPIGAAFSRSPAR